MNGKADIALYRSGESAAAPQSYFFIVNSSNNTFRAEPFGQRADVGTMPGDYDGDGKTDIATVKNSVNDLLWTITRSSDDVTENVRYGLYSSDAPVQGDYDGDGKTELAVFRKTGTTSTSPSYFYIRQPNGSFTTAQFGNGFDYSIATRAY